MSCYFYYWGYVTDLKLTDIEDEDPVVNTQSDDSILPQQKKKRITKKGGKGKGPSKGQTKKGKGI